MVKSRPPEQFDFSRSTEWPVWRHHFDGFQVTAKLDKDSSEIQVNSFLYAVEGEAELIYESFVYDDGEENPEFDYKTVTGKFDEHFVSKWKIIYDRACFHWWAQKAGETVEAFVQSRYELVQHNKSRTTRMS